MDFLNIIQIIWVKEICLCIIFELFFFSEKNYMWDLVLFNCLLLLKCIQGGILFVLLMCNFSVSVI